MGILSFASVNVESGIVSDKEVARRTAGRALASAKSYRDAVIGVEKRIREAYGKGDFPTCQNLAISLVATLAAANAGVAAASLDEEYAAYLAAMIPAEKKS
jgi:hypothetical protein